MNAATQTEITALSLPERAAVALGDSANVAKLHELVKLSSAILLVNSKPGRDEAHRAGMVLAKTRTTITGAGKLAREDATAFSKAVIAMQADLIAIIQPEEIRVLTLRDGWDEAEQEAKNAKIMTEMERIAAIRARVAALRDFGADVMHGTEEQLHQAIKSLMDLHPAAGWDGVEAEFLAEAFAAWNLRLEQLRTARGVAEQREFAAAAAEAARIAEAAKLAAEREELRLLQVAQAQQAAEFAESQRLAKVEADAQQAVIDKQRREQAAAEQERINAQAAAVAAFRAEQAAHAAEVKRQADALAAQQAAADARDAAAARQAVIDAAHGEGLDENTAWDTEKWQANAGMILHYDEAVRLNALYDIETKRQFALIPVVAIATVSTLDVATLADSAGDEPATDAEIIAELVTALKWYIEHDETNEHGTGSEYFIDGRNFARAAIARTEGRAA